MGNKKDAAAVIPSGLLFFFVISFLGRLCSIFYWLCLHGMLLIPGFDLHGKDRNILPIADELMKSNMYDFSPIVYFS